VPKIPEKPDPYALAWLTGGVSGMVRLATFELQRLGAVTVGNDGLIQPAAQPPALSSLHPLAQACAEDLGGSRIQANGRYLKRIGRTMEFTQAAETYQEQWTGQGLAATPTQVRFSWLTALVAVGLIAGIGIERIVEAFSHGRHNVGFIVLLGVPAVIAAFALIPFGRMTKAGKAFVASVIDAHHVQPGVVTPVDHVQHGSVDPMLLGVSLLGVSALVGTPWSSMHDAFGRTPSAGGGCGSGSSCGSSSDSGGGSDGGGSGCGGGCGGGGD
jgi:uncharacterized protein (TIGR04222 family)